MAREFSENHCYTKEKSWNRKKNHGNCKKSGMCLHDEDSVGSTVTESCNNLLDNIYIPKYTIQYNFNRDMLHEWKKNAKVLILISNISKQFYLTESGEILILKCLSWNFYLCEIQFNRLNWMPFVSLYLTYYLCCCWCRLKFR